MAVTSKENPWGSAELFGLLAVAGCMATFVTVLPLWWVWKILMFLPATLFVFVVVSFFSPSLGRLARFLAGVSRPGPSFTEGQLGISGELRSTVIRRGVDKDDTDAGRIVAEYMDGCINVEEVLPAAADLKAALATNVKSFVVPVKSVRALRGTTEVARWRPNAWRRIQMAWRRA